jgi:hypothetical protein
VAEADTAEVKVVMVAEAALAVVKADTEAVAATVEIKVATVEAANTAESKADHKAIATSSVDKKKAVADTRDQITVADLMARDNLLVADKMSSDKTVTAVTIVADNLTDHKEAASSHGDAAETKWKTVSATREMTTTEADMDSRILLISSAAAEATADIISAQKTAAQIMDQEIQATRADVVMARKAATKMMIHLTEAEAATMATAVTDTNHLTVVAEAKNAVMATLLMVAMVMISVPVLVTAISIQKIAEAATVVVVAETNAIANQIK